MKKIYSLITIIILSFKLQSQTLQWAKALSGAGSDFGSSVTVDAFGNVYTTGMFEGTADFDPSGGIFNLTSAGNYDIFISKLDASGNFVWAKAMGGIDYDYGLSITTDAAGNVYSTGYFQGTADFDPGVTTFNLFTIPGANEMFISKLDGSGNFVWAKSLGGTNDDVGFSIVLDTVGNIYTTGYFEGTADFDPGVGTFNLVAVGNSDIFVAKLDAAGNFVWAKAMSGGSNEYGFSINLDAAGNVFTTGYFLGIVDFDPGIGTSTLTAVGTDNVFISKLDAAGNFVWVKGINGPNGERGYSLVTDASGNIYTTGYFYGTTDFDPGSGTFNLTSPNGSSDIFILKLDASGNFVWAKAMGGPNSDRGLSIALDGVGNIYTTGVFDVTADFDPGLGTFYLTSTGFGDIFVSKLDASGNFVWAGSMGGTSGSDEGYSIALDGSGSIYTTGFFWNTADFDPNAPIFNLTSVSSVSDIFVQKINQLVTVQELNTSFDFSISPNPSSGIFTVTSQEEITAIEIYNVLGENIISLPLGGGIKGGGETKLDLSAQAKGIYFIKVQCGDKVSTQKIVIE